MEHNNSYSLKTFLPLICIASLIILFTLIKQFLYGFNLYDAMADFMGAEFIIFSLFKIINISAFAEAYSMYDIIAKRYPNYGYIYPFIELFLGIAYLMRYNLMMTNSITLVLMIIGSIGVIQELARGKTIVCACLGVVFKIPMTYVTLAENCIMGVMALIMILWH